MDRVAYFVMSSFAGVSMVTGVQVHNTPAVDAGTDSGYHLLVVKDYSRTVQETPNGKSIRSGPFMVGGRQRCINYYPNGDLGSVDSITLDLHLVDVEMDEGVEVNFEFSFVDQVEYQKPRHIRKTKQQRCFSVIDQTWGY